jgi:hypothetical protein
MPSPVSIAFAPGCKNVNMNTAGRPSV